jgi:hypothetical protein
MFNRSLLNRKRFNGPTTVTASPATATTIKEAVVISLKATSSITTLVGSRIFPNHATRGAARPLIIVRVASDTRGRQLSGNNTQRYARILFEAQAATDESAEAIVRALDAYLQTIARTTISGIVVKSCLQAVEGDEYVSPANGTDTGPYSRVAEYIFDYRL